MYFPVFHVSAHFSKIHQADLEIHSNNHPFMKKQDILNLKLAFLIWVFCVWVALLMLMCGAQDSTMMLLRINMRTALAALCIAVLLIIVFWTRCGELSHRPST